MTNIINFNFNNKIFEVPEEIYRHITEYLPQDDKYKIRFTSKNWLKLCQSFGVIPYVNSICEKNVTEITKAVIVPNVLQTLKMHLKNRPTFSVLNTKAPDVDYHFGFSPDGILSRSNVQADVAIVFNQRVPPKVVTSLMRSSYLPCITVTFKTDTLLGHQIKTITSAAKKLKDAMSPFISIHAPEQCTLRFTFPKV